MASKTNTKTTTKTTKKVTSADVAVLDIHSQTNLDFKNSVLIVSLLVNVLVLVAWLMLKVTSQFDHQIAFLLFYR